MCHASLRKLLARGVVAFAQACLLHLPDDAHRITDLLMTW